MTNVIYNSFKFSLLLLLLQSMFAWFLWGQLFLVIFLAISSTVLFSFTGKGVFCFRKSNIIPLFFLVIVQLYVIRDLNINALIATSLRIVILSIVLLVNDQIKIDLFQFFTRAFAILLSISLFAWILFLLGISLPYSLTEFNQGQYIYDNYYFFLLNHVFINLPIPRFSSVFLEPGHLGMITSFLLYANRFELKRKTVLIIFIATLFTFSLAAYVLLLISISVYVTLHSKHFIRNFVLWGLVLFSLYSYFSKLNEGENIVNNLILKRLQIKDGDLAGDNRFSYDLDDYFQQFMNTDNKYLGIGSLKYGQITWQRGSAGYKIFILEHGIIGTLLLFLVYFSMVIFNKSKLSFMFLVVYTMSFLQRAYALWDVELIIFITAIPILSLYKIKSNVETV